MYAYLKTASIFILVLYSECTVLGMFPRHFGNFQLSRENTARFSKYFFICLEIMVISSVIALEDMSAEWNYQVRKALEEVTTLVINPKPLIFYWDFRLVSRKYKYSKLGQIPSNVEENINLDIVKTVKLCIGCGLFNNNASPQVTHSQRLKMNIEENKTVISCFRSLELQRQWFEIVLDVQKRV